MRFLACFRAAFSIARCFSSSSVSSRTLSVLPSVVTRVSMDISLDSQSPLAELPKAELLETTGDVFLSAAFPMSVPSLSW